MARVQDGKEYFILNLETHTAVELADGNPTEYTKIQNLDWQVHYFGESTDKQVWRAKLVKKIGDDEWFHFTNRKGKTAIEGPANNDGQLFGGLKDVKKESQQWILKPDLRATIGVYQLYRRTPDGKSYSPELSGGNRADRTPISLAPSSQHGTNLHQLFLFLQADAPTTD